MQNLKKYWYLVLLSITTIGIGILVFLTSQRLSQTGPVAPTVPQGEPQAVRPACTLTFTLATPTPTPASQITCESTTISGSTISQAVPLTVTVTISDPATDFSLAFYNLDNLYSANNPKPIYFAAGQHFIMSKQIASTTTTSFTINFSDINKPDLNNNGQIPTNIQVNAYFKDPDTGQTSGANANCVEQFSVNVPSVTLTPTATATLTLTPTQPTSITPTPVSQCNAVCETNSDCPSNLICSQGACRNASCVEQSDCTCGGIANSPTPTSPPLAGASPSPLPTPQVPVSGIGPSIMGVSIITIGSLLVLLGLAL